MTNEVARVAYTPTASISKEQLEKLKQDDKKTSPVIFDAANNQGSDLQLSGKINLTKEQNEILIKKLEEKVKSLEQQFNEVHSRQGWIGKSWNWLKNVTGLGAGSDKAQKAINELKSKMEIAKANPEKIEETFKEITGQELTLGNLQKLETGELGLKGQERIAKYEQGQGMAKGLFSTIATIGAVTGVMALGIIGTPFTGGMSLGASLAASAAILGTGAAVSVAVNASDAMTSDAKDYSWKQAGKDAISGSVDGALTVATMGIGNVVARGTQVAANSARFAKFGQVLVKPAVQHTIIGTSTGVVFGGGGSATEYLLNADEYGFSDFLSATGKGALNGAVFGGVAGGVGSKAGLLNTRVANSTSKMNSKFLAKTLNGTTKAVTTAATGFVGGGVSSVVGYLIDADRVTAEGMLEAFTEGGQGGAAMMVGFEAMNSAIMSTPRAKKVLRQKQINSVLEMWGVKPESKAERIAYEKMAESLIDAKETKSKEISTENSKREDNISKSSQIKKFLKNMLVKVKKKYNAITKAKEKAMKAEPQDELAIDPFCELYDKVDGRVKGNKILSITNMPSVELVKLLAEYEVLTGKKIDLPKDGFNAEFYQQILELTTGSTKFAQIVSSNKKFLSKISDPEIKKAILNTRSNCSFSRTIEEAQEVLDTNFRNEKFRIIKELSAASIGDAYLVQKSDGEISVLKMLKKGVTREKLALEEKIYKELLKGLMETPEEAQKYSEIIENWYKDFAEELNFSNEYKYNKMLHDGAKRYKVADISHISEDKTCIIMDMAHGIQMSKLVNILQDYIINPKEYAIKYKNEIQKNTWLQNPKKVIKELPDILARVFAEQFMFLKKGGKSIMHGDPHTGNFFITVDEKGRLMPEFIDTGNCIIRKPGEIVDECTFLLDYYIGNSEGIAKHFVRQSSCPEQDKKLLTKKISKLIQEKILENKETTDLMQVQNNIFAILEENGLSISAEYATAMKAEIQFYTAMQEVAKLAMRPLPVNTILKDLPRAILGMISHGKIPFELFDSLKFMVKNPEKAIYFIYNFSNPIRIKYIDINQIFKKSSLLNKSFLQKISKSDFTQRLEKSIKHSSYKKRLKTY